MLDRHHEPGIFRDGDDLPEMAIVPAGAFLMGSPEDEPHRHDHEGPQHRVMIGCAFALGRYPVTFAEFDAFVAATGAAARPDDKGWGRGRRPVFGVEADGSEAWRMAGRGFRVARGLEEV